MLVSRNQRGVSVPEMSYPPDFVTNLEMQWGAGFLSPGGPDEVLEILRVVEVRNKQILDIGCGTGGPDIVIANVLKPRKIVGIDIEPYLIEQAKSRVGTTGLDQII